MSTPTFSVVTVTPAMAREWLDRDDWNNRPLNAQAVTRYARDMSRSEWYLNGEPLIFNGTKLLDGQHRLAAVVAAGIPVKFAVIDNVDQDAFLTIDTGRKRTVSDTLVIAGEQNTAHMGATLQIFHHLYTFNNINSTSFDPSRMDVARHIERLGSERIQESISYGRTVHRILGGSASLYAALHLYLGIFHREQANTFFETLAEGDGLYPGSPIRTLRNYLLNQRPGSTQSDRRKVAAVTITAWNARRRGYSLSRLAYNSSKPLAKPV